MANWYSTDWWHRLPLTIPHGQFSGDVALTLPLSGLNLPDHFWSKVKADGTDIVVASSDGVTKLKRQIAYINTATKVLEVYVQWPSLSAPVDTPAWLYYGNPAAAETDDADTWPAEWVFASPMADYNSGTQIKDFSQYANHGTKGEGSAAPTEVAGPIGRAQQFVAANGQYIQLPKFDLGLGSLSVLALVKADSPVSTLRQIIGCSAGGGLRGWGMRTESDGRLNAEVYGSTGGRQALRTVDIISAGDWTIAAGIFNRDGFVLSAGWESPLATLAVADWGNGAPSNSYTLIGTHPSLPASGFYWDGPICELWLSSVALSPDEIAAIDAALRGTATFYSVGAYEHRPLYIMQGYRRMTDGATATPQTYRRAIERTTYAAQGYRRLTTAAEYITQAYRRLADKALYTIATKRRLRTLYRILGRPSYAMDHRPKPDYGLGTSGRANDRHR